MYRPHLSTGTILVTFGWLTACSAAAPPSESETGLGGAGPVQTGTGADGSTTAAGGGTDGVNGSSVGGVGSGGTSAASGTGSQGSGGNPSGTTSTPSGVCVESQCGSHKWACWKVPTPVSEKLSSPQSYTDLGNGAVRDNVTCLVWEKANPATQGTLQASIDRCASLAASGYAGYSDWRMPTRIEMASITDVTLGSKGYPTVFSLTSGYYMTGSDWYKTILTDKNATAGDETNMVWGYGTNGFTSNAIVRSGSNMVARCVRGNGAGEAQGEYAVEPPNHYTVASGEVTDNYTGLVWQQGFSPTLLTHDEAKTYCSTLAINGHSGFRVPALNELATTVNEAKVGGAIVDSAFPNNPVGCKDPKYWFWAAESYGSSNYWGLSYCDGFTGYNAGASGTWNYFPTANVRCVR